MRRSSVQPTKPHRLLTSKIVTLDFETYYDDDYTLSKTLSTSEYVRDPRFKAHMVQIKIGRGKTRWYAGRDIAKAIKTIDWSTHALLAQNTAFDGLILSHHYGVVPAYYLDTLSMSRGLHGVCTRHDLDTLSKIYGFGGKVAGALVKTKGKRDLTDAELKDLAVYGVKDVDDCRAIFDVMWPHYPQAELDLIDLTLRMFCDSPLEVDIELARSLVEKEQREKAELIAKTGVDPANLSSNPKFALELQRFGVKPPVKVSLKTGQETFAFAQNDPEFEALLEHDDHRVVALVEARLAVKSTINETRAQRFVTAGETGGLPAGYNYFGAHCVPGDVEVLTRNGWERLDQWGGGDIAQVTLEQTINFRPAKRFEGPIETEWLELNAPYLKCQFTLGHTMPFISRPANKWAGVKAGDFDKTALRYVPLAGKYTPEGGAIDAAQARVLAMIQADGSFEQDTAVGRRCAIFVKKPRKIARARELLTTAGVIYEEKTYPSWTGYVRFVIRHRDYPAWLAPERKFFGPWILDCTHEGLEAFVEELQYWDGWVQGGQQQYSTSERQNAEWAQTLCHLTGRCASIHTKTQHGNRKTNYVVSLRQRDYGIVRRSHAQRIVAPQRTYCTMTETGYWLARSHGQIFVTGNTGRWSGSNKMNVQNLSRAKKDEAGNYIPLSDGLRRSVLAPKGYVLVVADSAQIEPRTNAWLAGHSAMLDVMSAYDRGEGPDIYCVQAESVYGRPINKKVDTMERHVGKGAVLGLGYQMGATKFQGSMIRGNPSVELPLDFCRGVVNVYRRVNKPIVNQWSALQSLLVKLSQWRSGQVLEGEYGTGGVVQWRHNGCASLILPDGLGIHYPDLRRHFNENGQSTGFSYCVNNGRKNIYGGAMTENIVQRLARSIVAWQMWQLSRRWRVVLMTHDEIVCCVPTRQADKCLADMVETMKTPPEWAAGLPLNAEGGFSREYSK